LLFPIGWLGLHCFFVFPIFYFLGKKIQLVEAHWLFDLNCGTRKHFLGFHNTSVIWSRGNEDAILVDQPGTFVVLSTLGILVATLLLEENRMGQILKKFLFSAIYYFYSSLFVECIWF
jgi:hypothetical protein